MGYDDSEGHRKRRQIPSNIRRENRHSPNRYMPTTVIFPRDSDEDPIEGVTREESDHGFSASFDVAFPYEEGDIVDVRVGFQRAWAEVKWTINVMDKKTLAGFQLHPEPGVPREERE